MSSWNQNAWGVQATSAYTIPTYGQPLAGVAAASAVPATTMAPASYGMPPGYPSAGWPGYNATATTPAAAANATASGVSAFPSLCWH